MVGEIKGEDKSYSSFVIISWNLFKAQGQKMEFF